ncbi:MarR family winged helix-turn-helix transcriptional regulator [Rosistilla oblonga]|uniref:MarR family winged helix-turn-helix transcriptional regulator n=1 Tax=Rosistilla oblonga TaxID=2527990 RepID=UPI003A96DC5A
MSPNKKSEPTQAPRPLQQELKKKAPFTSPHQEAVLNVLRTSDQFQNRFGRLLRKYGLTGSQYNVLRILRGEGKPLPSLEIADRMIQVVPAITGLIDRLEKQGFVSRDRSTIDRRVVNVAITNKGLDVLEPLDRPVNTLHKQLLKHLDRSELAQLSHLLEKARSRIDALDD